jgi:mono/diheme cytochrome c family protein
MRYMLPAAALLVLFAASSCGSARKVPPVASPVEMTSQKVAHGRTEFYEYCHRCHPHGEAGLGPAINDKPLPSFLIRFQVRNGLGAMPPFPKEVIDNEELDAIVAYLKALRRNE